MPLIIERSRGFEVTETLLETLGLLHGAIDPDSGHIICHHYRFGVFYAKQSGNTIPLFSIEGCLFITIGEKNVEAIVKSNDAVEAGTLSITEGSISIGDVKLESYWALLALNFIRETGGRFYLYKVDLVLDGKPVKAAALLAKPEESAPIMIILPSKCIVEKKEVSTHM